jgi:hypothetical protein
MMHFRHLIDDVAIENLWFRHVRSFATDPALASASASSDDPSVHPYSIGPEQYAVWTTFAVQHSTGSTSNTTACAGGDSVQQFNARRRMAIRIGLEVGASQ